MKTNEKKKKGPRDSWAIALTAPEIEILDGLVAHLGMTKQELMRRMFAWLAAQSDPIQKAVLGVGLRGPEGEKAMIDVLKKIVEEAELRREPRGVIYTKAGERKVV